MNKAWCKRFLLNLVMMKCENSQWLTHLHLEKQATPSQQHREAWDMFRKANYYCISIVCIWMFCMHHTSMTYYIKGSSLASVHPWNLSIFSFPFFRVIKYSSRTFYTRKEDSSFDHCSLKGSLGIFVFLSMASLWQSPFETSIFKRVKYSTLNGILNPIMQCAYHYFSNITN